MAQKAKQHAAGASAAEKALVEAIQYRYPSSSVPEDFSPSTCAYADAVRKVLLEFVGDDMDITTLTADALMNTNP